MIGYVQSGTFDSWLEKVNSWITDEARKESSSEEAWSDSETLRAMSEDVVRQTAVLSSVHSRNQPASSPQIHLTHLWVVMDH
jgi:hypothetical protein